MEKPKLLLTASFLIFDAPSLGTVENKMVRSPIPFQNKIIIEFGENNKIAGFYSQRYWLKNEVAHIWIRLCGCD